MQCPNCKTELKRVTAESFNAGLCVQLDQCPECGGIWFDQMELYKVPLGSAEKIDRFDEDLLYKKTAIGDDLLCPKDHSKLTRFSDYNIPKDVHIIRCEKCGGSWLNRGELLEYRRKVDKRYKESQDKPDLIIRDAMQGEAVREMNRSIAGALKFIAPLGGIAASGKENSELYFALSPEEIMQLRNAPEDEKVEMYRSFLERWRIERDKEQKENLAGGIMDILFIMLRLFLGR